ncbi:hypothetical protein KC324_g18539 [Hortaea werneckii]|nr:hypothetical protein KC324_g18539 [Hortaea werneckii]
MTIGSAGGVAVPAPEIRPEGRVDDDDDATWEVDGNIDAQPKKKRKVIKNGDKKYHCPHEDCGKAYSRAEHLYRHQLNHTPKTIYRCDFPGFPSAAQRRISKQPESIDEREWVWIASHGC